MALFLLTGSTLLGGALLTTPNSVSTASAHALVISQWAAPPNLRAYSLSISGPYAGGQCTQYAWYKEPKVGSGLGNAKDWAANARAHGLSVDGSPRHGDTAVFPPGVQGAGGLGHVAHVEEVYGGGWYLISEMNFSWNGGGLGRVDFRYANTNGGVQFIH